MGRFVNPDNSAFQVALNSEIYVDKTELITYPNFGENPLFSISSTRSCGEVVRTNTLKAKSIFRILQPILVAKSVPSL